jgi:hypothetical protein
LDDLSHDDECDTHGLTLCSFFLLLEALLLVEGSISASSVRATVDLLALVFLVDRALSEASGKADELADLSIVGSLFEELDPRVLGVVVFEDRLFVGGALIRFVVAGGVSSRSDSCGLWSITIKVLGFTANKRR